MSKLEILCVTMHQSDFSKIKEMNITSDVVFANQADKTDYRETVYDGTHTARMITTSTRGVGVNRNLALLYAKGDICLFADDDVVYADDAERKVLGEFEAHPDADVIIFHLDTDDPVRKQRKYPVTRKCRLFEKMPWGGVRIAVRLSSVRKANVWFTTLFGGGCIFPSGEDSMWLKTAKKQGLCFYVSSETIGTVSFADSTWYTGKDAKFFFGKGAYYEAVHPRTFFFWTLYFAFRTRSDRTMSPSEKKKWMKLGREGYRKMKSYDEIAAESEMGS